MIEATYPKFDADGVKAHYQELSRQRYIQQGRQEVVEWIEGEGDEVSLSHCEPSVRECPECWQAQKKVWFNEKV